VEESVLRDGSGTRLAQRLLAGGDLEAVAAGSGLGAGSAILLAAIMASARLRSLASS
jgi:hypothetical protein